MTPVMYHVCKYCTFHFLFEMFFKIADFKTWSGGWVEVEEKGGRGWVVWRVQKVNNIINVL